MANDDVGVVQTAVDSHSRRRHHHSKAQAHHKRQAYANGISYAVGEKNVDNIYSGCPSGYSVVDTQEECQNDAANALGLEWQRTDSWTSKPFGCLQKMDTQRNWFNTYQDGPAGHPNNANICKKSLTLQHEMYKANSAISVAAGQAKQLAGPTGNGGANEYEDAVAQCVSNAYETPECTVNSPYLIRIAKKKHTNGNFECYCSIQELEDKDEIATTSNYNVYEWAPVNGGTDYAKSANKHISGSTASNCNSKFYYGAIGVSACEERCNACDGCQGFVDNRERDPPYCVFKASTNTANKNDKDFYTKQGDVGSGPSYELLGHGYCNDGRDKENGHTLESCADKCRANQPCAGFSFNTFSGNNQCLLSENGCTARTTNNKPWKGYKVL